MTINKYYDLSSDNDSDSYGGNDGYNSCSSSEDDEDAGLPNGIISGQDPLWRKTILHLDIDCFYVQAEEIERGLRSNGKSIPPMAIGQKHIIVTCNYLARSFGVKKLQSKREALEACPTLWIVDGSDLRHYRKHSRAVYEAFRRVMYELYRQVFRDDAGTSAMSMEATMKQVPCVKGSMDEMMADLSTLVNRMANEADGGFSILTTLASQQQNQSHQKLYIFGEDTSRSIELVEDQTGASTTVSCHNNCASRSLSQSRRNVHETHNGNKIECQKRLEIATHLARFVCSTIQEQTFFQTTVGISVSPMLAKLASGLKKPKAINVLWPWKSSDLMYGMPLRKMPNIGHSTMRVLEDALRDGMANNSGDGRESAVPYTVLDFLRLPKEKLVECLNGLQASHSSEKTCELLLEKCRGLDKSAVVDDEGAITKTVSVEDSFHRGTVKSMDKVWEALYALFIRLPKLLQDRADISSNPKLAYPSTLRLTVRVLDPSLQEERHRRPFVTRSKQMTINGKALMEVTDAKKQASLLTEWVKPLVKTLLITKRSTSELDLTRINLAVTGFADVARKFAASSSFGPANLQVFMKKRHAESQSHSKGSSTKRLRTKNLATTRIDHFFFKKS